MFISFSFTYLNQVDHYCNESHVYVNKCFGMRANLCKHNSKQNNYCSCHFNDSEIHVTLSEKIQGTTVTFLFSFFGVSIKRKCNTRLCLQTAYIDILCFVSIQSLKVILPLPRLISTIRCCVG